MDIEVSTEQFENTQWPCNSLKRRRFVFDGAIGFGLEQQTEDPSIDYEQQQPPDGDQFQVPRTQSLSDPIGNLVFCNARAHHADLPTLYASVARPRCYNAPSHKPPSKAKCRQASLLHESGASANKENQTGMENAFAEAIGDDISAGLILLSDSKSNTSFA